MIDTYKNIRLALLKAQKSIHNVEKDAKNAFHKYDYVSSEAMVSACRAALHGAGLTAERNEWTIDQDCKKVIMHFELAHGESGEARRYNAEWPIIEDKGRPFDKALAGALTTSLNYWLRDILLVARKDDEEVDRRDDRNHEPREEMESYKATPAQKRILGYIFKQAGVTSVEDCKKISAECIGLEMRQLSAAVAEWLRDRVVVGTPT